MENQFSEIFKYLKMIQKRRYLFLAVSLLVMTCVTGASYYRPKQYMADSTVFIERSVINNLIKGIAVTPDMDDRIRVLKYALLSRDIIGKVLAELDWDTRAKNSAELQDMITDLQRRTDLKIKGNDLFIVSITDQDPEFAQKYINTLVSTYVEENLSAKREETYGANRFLDEQIVLFKKKLDESENAIIEFRRSQGIMYSGDEKVLLQEVKEFQKEIENLNLSIDTLGAKKRRLKSQQAELEPTVTIFSEKLNSDRIAQLQAKIAQLMLSYTENYPEVVRLKAELDGLKKRIQEEGAPKPAETQTLSVNPVYQDVTQKLLDVEAEISSLEARRDRLMELSTEREKELQFVPETKKQLTMLIQERDSHKKIYEELLMRMGQSEVSKQMEIGDKATTFRIVDPAIFPEVPVSPNMVKMLLLAIAAGFGCGFVVVFLLDSVDTSVKDVNQLDGFGVEVLAVIPTITDQAVAASVRRKDVLVYACALLYFGGIVSLLAWEALKRLS
ncbi:chain-length determining protein [Desulfuromonas versatilis]|uniref:Chain-length determining protein n=1 Tax=Desulfuromonas versatilis TaxID=2802975 RepID=A0ABM8HTI2_9BACT|nr:XrtA system polysaccharide chain length determinant [Desulfuromonas versatilis]BCR05289.1 chain-length determining protein [Desulfuromonas versatilis]